MLPPEESSELALMATTHAVMFLSLTIVHYSNSDNSGPTAAMTSTES